jgi:hypothetical protein
MGLAMRFSEDNCIFDLPDSPEADIEALQNCSISLAANQAMRACKATRSALGSLREGLISCPHCPAVKRCELHEFFNLLIDQAVAALSEEWGW